MTVDILYDVTNLGLSFGTEMTRTGIFRATCCLVREVQKRPDLNPTFAALVSYVGELQLARFDRSSGALAGRRTPAWTHAASTLEESMALVDRITAAPERVGEADGDAGARRLAAELQLLNSTARPLSLGRSFDIYHSLRLPLVARDRVSAGQRVITIYDMVPFLFPDLVDERFVGQHRALLRSIDPDRDWIMANSESTKNDVCMLAGIDPGRIFVTPLAAAPEVFHPESDPDRIAAVRRAYGLADKPYILSLGTLEPRKNLVRLVRSFAALTDDTSLRDLQLVLVGPTGWKIDALFAALAQHRGLDGRVVRTGFVPDADLAALYSGAHMFVFPSLYEGFGLPALEAMQCGTPVITSQAGSLPEVVGDAAIMVSPTDEDALADAMLTLLRDPEAANGLGRRGIERSRRFTWSRTVDDTVRAYRTIVAQSA